MGRVVVWRGSKRVREYENSAYDAASNDGRLAGWREPSTGPNTTNQSALETVRNRSRGAVRNNPWIFQAIDRLVSNEVGIGARLSSACKDDAVKSVLDELWADHSNAIDVYGCLPFSGIQTQAVRARRIAGECFIRRRRAPKGSPLPLPFRIQVLESDFVPVSLNRELDNGNQIIQGIEFNPYWRRVAYWMYTRHPGERNTGLSFNDIIRVPASEVIHHYDATGRPGQIRGEPASVRSLIPARTFDLYENAELIRKETRAPFTGAIKRPERDASGMPDPVTGQLPGDYENQHESADATPGTLLSLFPGEEIELFDGDNTGQGFGDYSRAVLLKVAAAYGMPYELVSGDWRNVNDRLVRAVLNEFRRGIEASQEQLLLFQIGRGVWKWVVDSAIISGKLRVDDFAARRDFYYRVSARTHAWAYVHPEQDVNTSIKLLDNALASRESIIDSMPGPSMDEIDRQNEADTVQRGSTALSTSEE